MTSRSPSSARATSLRSASGRGLSLLVVSQLFAASPHPSMLVFILFYGLDWVATVPPTVALCRQYFGEAGPVVFGWVFASHQVGAAIAATAAGLTRDHLGTYGPVWYVAGALCLVAASFSARLPAPERGLPSAPAPEPELSPQRP